MKKALVFIGIIISVSSALTGCYYDKEEIVYPKTTCDTANLTYTGSIETIIQNRCYSCHSGAGGGISGTNLDSYDDLKFNANEAVRRITTTDISEMMPKGGPRLSDCEISKITAWVHNGTPR